MLLTKLNLLLLITFAYCFHVDAWIQGRNCERLNKFGLRSSSEDLNFQKFQLQLESIFFEDTVNLKDETTLHIGGLYESLSPLPVHDWADSEVYFDDGDWIDLSSCRDEECEQCEIPEDYKDYSGQLDVLEFLGIQRAEPLRVNRLF